VRWPDLAAGGDPARTDRPQGFRGAGKATRWRHRVSADVALPSGSPLCNASRLLIPEGRDGRPECSPAPAKCAFPHPSRSIGPGYTPLAWRVGRLGPGDERSAAPSVGETAAPDPDSRTRWLLRTLRAAVAHSCPAELASQREDLVQAALLRVLEHERAGEHNVVRTASYLWRVAFSAAADELRRQRSEVGRRSMSADLREPKEASVPGPELGLGIRDCLTRLAEQRRAAVLLHLEGFRAEEVSRVLGWDLKRIRNLTYRGLADLRRCLADKGLAR